MNVLVASDGSAHSRAVVALLGRIPLPPQTRATLLTVIPHPTVGAVEDGALGAERDLRERIVEASAKEAQQLLEGEAGRLREALGGTASEVVWRIARGDPAREIIQSARELEADLVAVGARGLSALKRFLLGSVSTRVVSHAPCSVLLARTPGEAQAAPAADERLRVLLAFDGRDSARPALARLASLPLGERAEATLVGVVERAPIFGVELLEEATGVSERAREAVGAALYEGAAALRAVTPHVATELRDGTDATEEIVAVARGLGADLVIVGSRRVDGVQRFFTGGAASRIAHHAPCSVWVERG